MVLGRHNKLNNFKKSPETGITQWDMMVYNLKFWFTISITIDTTKPSYKCHLRSSLKTHNKNVAYVFSQILRGCRLSHLFQLSEVKYHQPNGLVKGLHLYW